VSPPIPDFSSARLLVAGDVMLDRYLIGATERVSPEAPVPVVHIAANDNRPGGAANVAVNLASLEVPVALLGLVGQDENGAELKSALSLLAIENELIAIDGWPTITKTRVQSRGQQLLRVDREEPLNDGSAQLNAAFTVKLQDCDAVLLSDYGKGSLDGVADMITACRSQGVPVYVDPKGSDFTRYRGATLLTPNQGEFERVAGQAVDDDDLVAKARTMIASLDLRALLITRSEKGMLLVERDREPEFLRTRAREVYDVAGAGDTVIAVLAAAHANGLELAAAAELANLAAGLVVAKSGVASVSPAELSRALGQCDRSGRGVIDVDELCRSVADAHGRGERVVMTNGCFDVLHAGHVSYLEEAKSLGDRLIVAVNDDDSVSRLKGESRPINSLADRMAVLAGLAAVDWVVPFSKDTPESLIKKVLPDILVKGGDYRPDEIAGSRDVLENGGDVRVLGFREGLSSSNIIDRLNKLNR